MIPVQTRQRYKCQFCKQRGIKSKIEWHEKQCYRNPARICDACKNTRYDGEGNDCVFCAKFNPKLIEEIKKNGN